MARKKVIIDWDKANKLFEAGCNGAEAAAFFGVHYNTLVKCFKRDKIAPKSDLSEYIALKRGGGDALLKVRLYQGAMDGDKALQIFLAKSRLGMSDRPELSALRPYSNGIPVPLWVNTKTPEDHEDEADVQSEQ